MTRTRGLHGAHQRGPSVDLDAHHAIEGFVGLVGHKFALLEPGTVDDAGDGVAKVRAKFGQRFPVHDVHGMVLGQIARGLNAGEGLLYVT